jgi:hypothetical protein
MAINDFSALIQFTATLCIAFVAVEYVRSFIGVLCERFFKFQEFIATSFQVCRSILTDRDTLDHIEPIIIEGKSTNPEIEEAKRQNEALNKEINEEEEKKKEEVKISCQLRSMSSLCFFLFLINVLVLLVGSVEKRYPDFSHILVSILDILSIVYLVYGWRVGENECPKKYRDFSSLRHSFTGFIIIMIFSLLVPFFVFIWAPILVEVFNSIWWFSLVAFIVLSYLNFIVFTFKIKNKATAFKTQVNKSTADLINKCQEAEKKVEELQGLSRLNARLQTD